jgi:hypothetical protein
LQPKKTKKKKKETERRRRQEKEKERQSNIVKKELRGKDSGLTARA